VSFGHPEHVHGDERELSTATDRTLGRLPFNADGKRVPLDVKPGDHIPFGKYTSQEVKLDGEATT
jgi:co-chaperonin GroES (HSP10)